MMREQEEAARNGFKSPRFFSSAGKIGFERKKKVPRRVRGENERQIRVRGKKDKGRNSWNSCKKDHQCEQCDPEGTYVSKLLLLKLGCRLFSLPCLCPYSWRATFMTRNRSPLAQICLLCNIWSHPQPWSKELGWLMMCRCY